MRQEDVVNMLKAAELTAEQAKRILDAFYDPEWGYDLPSKVVDYLESLIIADRMLKDDEHKGHYEIYVPLNRKLCERISKLREVLSTLEDKELTFSEAIEKLLDSFSDEITAWIGEPI